MTTTTHKGARNQTRAGVLAFVTLFVHEHGYSPSNMQICAELGLASTATAHYHVLNLEREGLITRGDPGSSRSIRPVAPTGCCPTCGTPRAVTA